MKLTKELQSMYVQTADALRGRERRLFMAQVVQMLGAGGQRQAEAQLGWNRGTIRKGLRELNNGERYEDNFSARGRKSAETLLPNLLSDIKELKDAQPCSAAIMRRRLITEKGYSDAELPTSETIRKKMKLV